MDDYEFTTPQEAARQAVVSRPLGWDHVFDWDDCRCPKNDRHQPGCDYHGWPQ